MEDPAVLVVRPRGWHLPERHVHVDGEAVSGSLFDFGLYVFHNPERAVGVVLEQPKALDSEHDNLRAALRWSCANDPDRMSSYCSAQGDDLDALYFRMVNAAIQCNDVRNRR